MPEIPVEEPQAETITELQSDKAEVVKRVNGFAPGYGLTKDDVPAEPRPEATQLGCTDHPDGAFTTGVGYAGGGFGPYNICRECGRIFAKTTWKDGSQNGT